MTRVGELDVSRETMERLSIYTDLLKKWNPRINLVSPNSLDAVWDRHVTDSAQLFAVAGAEGEWTDIGSGGGFPGLVVAILSAESAPKRTVTLIESDQRKATFLRTVARETGINCTVLAKRIEETPGQDADVLSARALADLDNLLIFAEHHLAEDGVALFPKGKSWGKEVEDANRQWSFDLEPIKSWTEPSAAILKIKGIKRV